MFRPISARGRARSGAQPPQPADRVADHLGAVADHPHQWRQREHKRPLGCRELARLVFRRNARRLHIGAQHGARRLGRPRICRPGQAGGEIALLLGPLMEEVGKDLDPFDLICHIAFDRKPLTRRERADNVKKRDVFTKYGEQARAVLDALLAKYADEGVLNLDDANVFRIAPFTTLGTPLQLVNAFGGKLKFEKAVHDMQAELYSEAG